MMNKGFLGITELADADYTETLRFPVWLGEPKFYDDEHDYVLAEACQGMEQYLQISSIERTEIYRNNRVQQFVLTVRIVIVCNKKITSQKYRSWKYEIFSDTRKMFAQVSSGNGKDVGYIYIPADGDMDGPYMAVRMNRRAGELSWWLCEHTNFYYGFYFRNAQDERHLFQPTNKSKTPVPPVTAQSQKKTAVSPPAPKPKSYNWQIAALIIVALLGAIYFSPSQEKSSSSSPKKPAVTQQAKVPSAPSSSSSSSTQKSEPAPAPAPKPEKKKEVDPVARSGVMTGYNPTEPVLNDSGLCEVTIDNSRNDMPVYVRIWDADAMMPVRSFYIRQGGQFTADNLDPGTYQVRYINLYEGGTASRGSKSENFELEQIQDAYGVQYSQLTLTLYKVRNGNTTTTSIDADEI